MGSVLLFNAERMQTIEDTTVVDGFVDVNGHLLLEQRNGTEIDAGYVVGPGFVWKGLWAYDEPYLKNDVVNYGGATWIALVDNLFVTCPDHPATWELFTDKGEPGTNGTNGTNGTPGGYLLGVAYPWAGGAVPSWGLEMNGQAVSRTTYSGLFAIWGTTFGVGNGTTTFNVPDWRGRTVVGHNPGDADFGTLGQLVGQKRTNHAFYMPGINSGNAQVSGTNYETAALARINTFLAAGGSDSTGVNASIQNVGGATQAQGTGAVEVHHGQYTAPNIQPSVAAKWIVCAATSSAPYDTEVQTALVNRVGVLESVSQRGVIPSSVSVSSGSATVATDGTVTLAAVGSFSLNGVFDGLYGDMYEIHGKLTCSADPGGSLFFRLREAGVDVVATSTYFTAYNYFTSTSWGTPASGAGTLNGTTAWLLGYRAINTFDLVIKRPRTINANREMAGQISSDGTNQVYGPIFSRSSALGGSYDGFTVYPNAAVTITGQIKVVKI